MAPSAKTTRQSARSLNRPELGEQDKDRIDELLIAKNGETRRELTQPAGLVASQYRAD
jgi:hypothetical protein